eukprot:4739451-Amphidinium_carterae.1
MLILLFVRCHWSERHTIEQCPKFNQTMLSNIVEHRSKSRETQAGTKVFSICAGSTASDLDLGHALPQEQAPHTRPNLACPFVPLKPHVPPFDSSLLGHSSVM